MEAQQETLPPKLLDRLEHLRGTRPNVAESVDYLRPIEAQSVLQSQANIDSFSHLLDFLPKAESYAALAKFGTPKKGWYAASANAIQKVFGADSPRFTALLAATSPQNSVEMNLLNTVNIWKNWTAAGRPADAASIKAIMGQSVAGQKLEESVLDAWVNNSVRALGSKDPANVVLSGPKVDSFFNNLMGDVVRVTSDAHIANVSGISQDILRVSPSEKQLAAGNPGLSQAYNAVTALIRQGGDIAGMSPAEAQETIWSIALPLTRLQKELGLPAREILERGLLTADHIRGTPDFSTLLGQNQYGDVLRSAGYGDEIDALVPHTWGPATIPDMTAAEQREIMAAAERIENLGALRTRQARNNRRQTRPKKFSSTAPAKALRALARDTFKVCWAPLPRRVSILHRRCNRRWSIRQNKTSFIAAWGSPQSALCPCRAYSDQTRPPVSNTIVGMPRALNCR